MDLLCPVCANLNSVLRQRLAKNRSELLDDNPTSGYSFSRDERNAKSSLRRILDGLQLPDSLRDERVRAMVLPMPESDPLGVSLGRLAARRSPGAACPYRTQGAAPKVTPPPAPSGFSSLPPCGAVERGNL